MCTHNIMNQKNLNIAHLSGQNTIEKIETCKVSLYDNNFRNNNVLRSKNSAASNFWAEAHDNKFIPVNKNGTVNHQRRQSIEYITLDNYCQIVGNDHNLLQNNLLSKRTCSNTTKDINTKQNVKFEICSKTNDKRIQSSIKWSDAIGKSLHSYSKQLQHLMHI